jgi:hypothetical protein
MVLDAFVALSELGLIVSEAVLRLEGVGVL